jgi:hypothetical protein
MKSTKSTKKLNVDDLHAEAKSQITQVIRDLVKGQGVGIVRLFDDGTFDAYVSPTGVTCPMPDHPRRWIDLYEQTDSYWSSWDNRYTRDELATDRDECLNNSIEKELD